MFDILRKINSKKYKGKKIGKIISFGNKEKKGRKNK